MASRPTRERKTADLRPAFHSVMHREYILLQQGSGGVFVFNGLSIPPHDPQATNVNLPSDRLGMRDDDGSTCEAIGVYGTGPSIGIYMQISETGTRLLG